MSNSLNNVNSGDSANSSCIQQVIDVLKGTAGAGNIPISITAVNDSANFALQTENQDGTNGRSFRAMDSSGNARLQVDINGPKADPDGTGVQTIVTTTHSQTLTNKTLTSPAVTGQSGTYANSSFSCTNGSSNTFTAPTCKVWSSTTFPLSTASAFLYPSWDTEDFKTDGAMHSTSSLSSRIFTPVPGKYLATFTVSFPFGGTGAARQMAIKVDDSVTHAFGLITSSLASIQTVTTVVSMSSADYFTFGIFTDSTVSLSVSSGRTNLSASVAYLSA